MGNYSSFTARCKACFTTTLGSTNYAYSLHEFRYLHYFKTLATTSIFLSQSILRYMALWLETILNLLDTTNSHNIIHLYQHRLDKQLTQFFFELNKKKAIPRG